MLSAESGRIHAQSTQKADKALTKLFAMVFEKAFGEKLDFEGSTGSIELQRAYQGKENMQDKLRQFDALIESSVISEIFEDPSVSQFIKRNYAIGDVGANNKELERRLKSYLQAIKSSYAREPSSYSINEWAINSVKFADSKNSGQLRKNAKNNLKKQKNLESSNQTTQKSSQDSRSIKGVQYTKRAQKIFDSGLSSGVQSGQSDEDTLEEPNMSITLSAQGSENTGDSDEGQVRGCSSKSKRTLETQRSSIKTKFLKKQRIFSKRG